MQSHLFISYAHEDRALMLELKKHLSLLQRQELISTWTDQEIMPGGEWQEHIDRELKAADIIILLISSDFLASDFCWSVELYQAMERHENKSACIIPIILRPCDWSSAPFSKLQALPRDGLPVSSYSERDIAWSQVSKKIRKIVEAPKEGKISKKKDDDIELLNQSREKWELTLNASFEELDPELMLKITDFIKKCSGDATLSVQRVRSGSVILELDILPEAAKLLEDYINDGSLQDILEYKIISFVEVKLTTEEADPDSWLLVVTRSVGETTMLGDEISITVLGIKDNQVRMGINCPRDVAVHREEIYERLQQNSETITH